MANYEHNEQINIISKGTSIKGDVVSDGDMQVDGTIDGNLVVRGKLFMGENGYINGTVASQNAELAGRIDGNIKVTGLLSLLKTSIINGDLVINQLSIEPGAQFSGHCSMGNEQRAEQNAYYEKDETQYTE
jgi:cytoskeletal protein CcmA (bactofilin family)